MKTDKTDVMLRLIVSWVLSDIEGRRTGEEMQYLIYTLLGKCLGKRQFWGMRRRWDDNTRMNLKVQADENGW